MAENQLRSPISAQIHLDRGINVFNKNILHSGSGDFSIDQGDEESQPIDGALEEINNNSFTRFTPYSPTKMTVKNHLIMMSGEKLPNPLTGSGQEEHRLRIKKSTADEISLRNKAFANAEIRDQKERSPKKAEHKMLQLERQNSSPHS